MLLKDCKVRVLNDEQCTRLASNHGRQTLKQPTRCVWRVVDYSGSGRQTTKCSVEDAHTVMKNNASQRIWMWRVCATKIWQNTDDEETSWVWSLLSAYTLVHSADSLGTRCWQERSTREQDGRTLCDSLLGNCGLWTQRLWSNVRLQASCKRTRPNANQWNNNHQGLPTPLIGKQWRLLMFFINI